MVLDAPIVVFRIFDDITLFFICGYDIPYFLAVEVNINVGAAHWIKAPVRLVHRESHNSPLDYHVNHKTEQRENC